MKTKTRWGVLGALLLSATVMRSDDQDGINKEYDRFGGVWSFVLVEVEGVKQPAQPFATHKMIIVSDERRFVVVQGPKITHGTFEMDPTKTPKQIDLVATDSKGNRNTSSSIYELEADTYKVCGSFRSSERPTELSSKPGSGTVFEILKREKQSVKDALAEVNPK